MVAATLSAAVGLLVIVAAMSRAVHPNPTEISSQPQPAVPDKTAAVPKSSDAPVAFASIPVTRQPVSVEQQISDLDDTINGNAPDDQKLEAVLAALENPEKKVRAAALEDVLMLDDRAAIPRLQELAGRVDNSDEKQALLDAADHLALPSLTEYREAHPTSQPPNSPASANRTGRALKNAQDVPGTSTTQF